MRRTLIILFTVPRTTQPHRLMYSELSLCVCAKLAQVVSLTYALCVSGLILYIFRASSKDGPQVVRIHTIPTLPTAEGERPDVPNLAVLSAQGSQPATSIKSQAESVAPSQSELTHLNRRMRETIDLDASFRVVTSS